MEIEEEGEGPTSPGVATSSGTPAMPRPSFVPGRANGEAVRCGVWALKLGEFGVWGFGVCRGEEGRYEFHAGGD